MSVNPLPLLMIGNGKEKFTSTKISQTLVFLTTYFYIFLSAFK